MNSSVKDNLLLIIGSCCFLVATYIHSISSKPFFNVDKQDSAFNIDKAFLQLTSMGNKRLIANIIWIQTLLESDQEKYKKKDFQNWMYLRFKSISILDPLFYDNYLYGGIYLSVIKDDLVGAADIFEAGIKHYPEDYYLNYYLGFNYFFEMGDYEKGYKVLHRIKDHPKAPRNLKFVINKLQFETTGDYEATLHFLTENYKITKDEDFKQKIAADIYSLVATRDLECLNLGKQNCNRLDATGKPYYQDSTGNWRAEREFREFKIFRPEPTEETVEDR